MVNRIATNLQCFGDAGAIVNIILLSVVHSDIPFLKIPVNTSVGQVLNQSNADLKERKEL